jgi:hypothetical protein
MRVIMTKSMPGSEDGIRVQQYEATQEYDMGEALAQSFVGSGCAVPAEHEESADADKKPAGRKKGKGPDENK